MRWTTRWWTDTVVRNSLPPWCHRHRVPTTDRGYRSQTEDWTRRHGSGDGVLGREAMSNYDNPYETASDPIAVKNSTHDRMSGGTESLRGARSSSPVFGLVFRNGLARSRSHPDRRSTSPVSSGRTPSAGGRGGTRCQRRALYSARQFYQPRMNTSIESLETFANPYQYTRVPSGTSRSGARWTTSPFPSSTPVTRHSDSKPATTTIPRLTTATTCEPIRSAGS